MVSATGLKTAIASNGEAPGDGVAKRRLLGIANSKLEVIDIDQ